MFTALNFFSCESVKPPLSILKLASFDKLYLWISTLLESTILLLLLSSF